MNKNRLIINTAHIFLWVFGLAFPAVIFYYFTGNFQDFLNVFQVALKILLPLYVLYFLNYLIFIPKLLFGNRKIWFYCLNFLLLFCTALPLFLAAGSETLFKDAEPGAVIYMKAGAVSTAAGYLIICISFILLAVGVRYIIRWNKDHQKLEEERRRNTEAELNWLKSQLNPHFLFNTLNNISSLVQIDADKAQDSISQLSDLLRYALYESNCRQVRVNDEVEFMRNYIDLMTLRCTEKTKVEVRFDRFDDGLMISPLLFISLIENAFKHGTSAHDDSFVSVDMGMSEGSLVFSCVNSIIQRRSADYSGPGIGLENMMRRLELLYPGNYTYEQFVEKDAYVAIVTIRNLNFDTYDEMHRCR